MFIDLHTAASSPYSPLPAPDGRSGGWDDARVWLLVTDLHRSSRPHERSLASVHPARPRPHHRGFGTIRGRDAEVPICGLAADLPPLDKPGRQRRVRRPTAMLTASQ